VAAAAAAAAAADAPRDPEPVRRAVTAFADRRAAGAALGAALRDAGRGSDCVVLGLPRGGVPVAAEVAGALGARLDVFVVRKLGVPGHEELAMGALASGGVRVLNESVLRQLSVPDEELEKVTQRERLELARREQAYRGGRAPLALEGRPVVLVDDGLATGSTMRAAVAAVRLHRPARVEVAVPVGADDACALLAADADEVLCLHAPRAFLAVGGALRGLHADQRPGGPAAPGA
jgi:predicted phosphoribosyltransferase